MEATPDILDLSARMHLFQTLAVCFGDPKALEREIHSAKLHESLTQGVAGHSEIDRLQPLIDALLEKSADLAQSRSAASGSEAPTLTQEYTYLFRRKARVPLNEASYGVDLTFARTREMADVAAYYAVFGFELADGAGEMPDHIGVQLEFLGMLCFKEAYARHYGWSEQADVSRKVRKKYLTEHLTGWMPVFVKTLARHARLHFFPAAATLAREAITIEHASVDGGEPTMVLRPFKEAPGLKEPMTCGACPAAQQLENEVAPPLVGEIPKKEV